MTDPNNLPQDPPPGPPARDPRLEIPEVLRDKPVDPRTQHVETRRESFGDTAKAWALALDLVFTTIGGLLIGLLIDWWLGTGPWGAIIGLALGFVLAAVRMVKKSIRDEKREQAEREARRQASASGEGPSKPA